MDVHAETIAVALAEQDGEVRIHGVIPNRVESIRKLSGKLVGKLGPAKRLRVCYEAGPTGYALYWQLAALGVACEVIAPSLIPRKPGERIKTDRRDAEKLARCHRAGELTAVWVPDADHEALRDLVRAREAAKKDQLSARHRLGKFLLRHAQRPPSGVKPWTKKYLEWVHSKVRFEQPALEATPADYLHEVEHAAERIVRLEKAIDEAVQQAPVAMRAVIEALQALRGVAQTTAATIVAELGSLSRFQSPKQLMGYSGLSPASTPAAIASYAARSPRAATRTCAECSSKPLGLISIGPTSAAFCCAAKMRSRSQTRPSASVLSASWFHPLRHFPYHRQPGSQVPHESPG
jgi:transposase